MILPPYLQRWLFLNTIRLLTITTCSLVISATIRTLVINFHHYPPPLLSSSSSSSSSPYYPSTDIPPSFLGVFWSTLHHTSTLLILFIVILSELSLPIPLVHRLFKNMLPFLGPNWGLGFLGVLLLLVAGDELSRGRLGAGGVFGEVSSWCLAAMGVVNAACGMIWKAKAKTVRNPMGWKKEVAEKLEGLAEAKATAERVVDGLPLPASTKGKAQKGVSGLLGVAGKVIDRMAEKKVEKEVAKANDRQEREKEKEKDNEEVQEMTEAPRPAMAIFTAPLPSTIVSARPAAAQAQPSLQDYPSSLSSNSAASLIRPPPPTAISDLAPPPVIPTLHRTQPSLCSSSSVYSLDAPPLTNATFEPTSTTDTNPAPSSLKLTSDTIASSSVSASLPSRPPALKTVRFNSASPKTLSSTIDSHHPELGIDGSRFLLFPPLSSSSTTDPDSPRTLDGERSPSVLASLKAAMLEAQAKAANRANKKSIYLGSHKWHQEYTAASETNDEPTETKETKEPKQAKEKDRPYNFL